MRDYKEWESENVPGWINRMHVLEQLLCGIDNIMGELAKLEEDGKHLLSFKESVRPIVDEYRELYKDQNLNVCKGCGFDFVMDFPGDDACGRCEETIIEKKLDKDC